MARNSNNIISAPMKSKSLKKVATPIHSHMVSFTPGRLRFKVDRNHRNHEAMAPLTQALKTHLGVYDVRANPHSGSITVLHSPDHTDYDEIYATLQDLGVIFGDIIGEKSEVAQDITSAIYDLNRRVKAATSQVVDLRVLMPLGLGVLAVRQLLAKGLQLDIVPWYVLAWYSFDSFIKLHYTSDPQQPREQQ
jgi:Heavy metal associated domain 2